ncbi:MAG: M36 family metallopeptidase [Saprospiraceae bacterium]|nr:M36 family metallopeptidase [Saprospiraceae bacterium]
MHSNLVFSQDLTKLNIALKHIEQNAKNWNILPADIENLQISSEVTSNKGITYLYLNQTYENTPIRNAIATIVISKDGRVVSDAHNFVQNVSSKINTNSSRITPQTAILKSAEHLGISLKTQPEMKARTDQGKLTLEMPEFVKSEITAQLKYDLLDNKLILVWNLSLDMKKSADYWDMNIDALTGGFVSKHNFTTYCQHHKDAYARHDHCAINSFKKINKQIQSVSEVLANRTAATYNVFALPAESPNHGVRNTVSDDQFPAVSPFGWHDTDAIEGPEFTYTRGNNVYAYQDKDDDDESDSTDTEGGAGLNFDFPIDLDNDPRQTADASVTNLFYMVNMIHDVTATLGFSEEFGNFQQRNYSGKAGDGEGDYVLAQAFDGITLHEAGEDIVNGNPTKINNANFSTPNDGFNGRMQMFFWDNEGGAISIDAPESIKGFIPEYGTGQFGAVIPANNETPIKGNVALARDGSTNPTAGCNSLVNGSEVSGKIALINRGLCDFSNKVYRAQQAGAIAAIICNIVGVSGGNGEELIGMASGLNGGLVTIPSIFLKKSDCDKIRLVISNGGVVTMTFQERERVGAEYLDGALDNGIIAHEFGHGISNRLTGGRLSSSCLTNDEQMGEGWSDFFALIMTHEPGDQGSDSRGIGTFAAAQQITGSGIRRYPYSTDMNNNPQTFDHIKGTTSPHALGEVWTDVLWDMYWAFIDRYGYDPDWNNEESGNYKAAFLVIEGMKMQPCNPGFIQGRDAIIKADKVHHNDENKCLIWSVFSRRGLGYFADGGSKDDRNDGTENFESLPTCIEKLKISKTSTTSVNAGDVIDVEIKTINHIPSRQSNVIITDELPNGLTYVTGSGNIQPVINGNLLTFELGDMEYESAVNITYKAKTSTNNKSVRLEYDNFDGDITWDIQKNEGSEDWLPNYDKYRSPETSWYIINVPAEVDALLISTPFEISGTNPVMRIWHQYNTQIGSDGGFIEISTDNGPFEIIKSDKFIRNSYNSPIAYGTLAIPALEGFSGNSGAEWIDSYIDLSEYTGKTIVFRFRYASDATLAATGEFTGWYIDDFEILDIYKYVSQACIATEGGQGEKECTDGIETFVNSEGTVSADNPDPDYFAVLLTPNPANDYVVINATSPTKVNANVDVTNIDGKVVYKGKMNIDDNESSMIINTAGLPGGVYFVKIQSGVYFNTQKLIIR